MPMTQSNAALTLARDSNQALGLGEYAVDFMNAAGDKRGEPSAEVLDRTLMFFTDSILCGISAIALQTNAPTVLRAEAMDYKRADGASLFGSNTRVAPEKAIVANCAAVREWDSNGTNFGYNPQLGHTAGEFGHNDFYAAPIAAAQIAGLDGAAALRGMVLLDEIRGRLAEVFSLKTYKIDHVVHGAIGAAATYGAMLGATPEQIESAIGMTVAHYIPWRAIRAGKQLSDSKGASAALSTEAAIISMQRSMRGFVGPQDIFRNPEAIWRQFEPTDGDCPFDLVLSRTGDDFAVMGMHFKLGLYEHQSAGAIQGVINLIQQNPNLLESPRCIKAIKIIAYEPAFGIIGDPAKRDPRTRQSADHSMVYIISTLLTKAMKLAAEGGATTLADSNDGYWMRLILTPYDYHERAIFDHQTRMLMEKVTFEHGGADYDARYPDGIPTSVIITDANGATHDSGLVMYPAGHARDTTADRGALLQAKWRTLGELAVDDAQSVIDRFNSLPDLSVNDLASLYDFEITSHEGYES